MPTEPQPCRDCGKLTKAKTMRCYPCQRKNRGGEFARYKRKSWIDDPGPTEAEIERTIADVLSKPLPPWWDNSEHRTAIRESDDRPGIRVVRVRVNGGRRVAKQDPFLWG